MPRSLNPLVLGQWVHQKEVVVSMLSKLPQLTRHPVLTHSTSTWEHAQEDKLVETNADTETTCVDGQDSLVAT